MKVTEKGNSSSSRKRGPILTLIAATLCVPAFAADNYPTKPVRIIVPFAPGGGTDVTARIVAQPLSEKLGQPVVVENRPGAGTMLGTELTKNAAPDGYTLMIASASHAINPSLYRKVNYDPLRDFNAITLAISFPFLLAVNPAVPIQNTKELIAYAKANPGKLSYASSGIGATNHLCGELFKATARIDMVHVPYKGGGPAMNDVIGGQVPVMFGTVVETMPQARAGKLKALAVSSAKRAAIAPDIKTISEDGLPRFDVTGWYAFVAPAAVPKAVVARLNKEMTAILASASVRERLMATGAEPWPTSSEKAQAFIASETARWSKLIKAANITAD